MALLLAPAHPDSVGVSALLMKNWEQMYKEEKIRLWTRWGRMSHLVYHDSAIDLLFELFEEEEELWLQFDSVLDDFDTGTHQYHIRVLQISKLGIWMAMGSTIEDADLVLAKQALRVINVLPDVEFKSVDDYNDPLSYVLGQDEATVQEVIREAQERERERIRLEALWNMTQPSTPPQSILQHLSTWLQGIRRRAAEFFSQLF